MSWKSKYLNVSVLKENEKDFICLGCPLLAFENLLQSLKHIPVGFWNWKKKCWKITGKERIGVYIIEQ